MNGHSNFTRLFSHFIGASLPLVPTLPFGASLPPGLSQSVTNGPILQSASAQNNGHLFAARKGNWLLNLFSPNKKGKAQFEALKVESIGLEQAAYHNTGIKIFLFFFFKDRPCDAPWDPEDR
jgi:hypothetical protein